MFGHMGGFYGYPGNGFFGNGFRGYGHGFGYGIMGGGASQLLFLFLIGVVVYILLKRNSSNSSRDLFHSRRNIEAKEIAKLRYARGEITLEEYQQIINALN